MKTLTIPIFDVNIYLFSDREDACAFVKEHGGPDADVGPIESSRGLCYEAPILDSRFKMDMLCIFDTSMHIVVHECVHMAWMTLVRVEVPVTQKNDEMLAYLSGYLVQEVYSFLGIEIPARV